MMRRTLTSLSLLLLASTPAVSAPKKSNKAEMLEAARAAKKGGKPKTAARPPANSNKPTTAAAATTTKRDFKGNTQVEVDTIASDLMSMCLSSRCDGDIAYSNCFTKEKMETVIASDSTCKALMSEATSPQTAQLIKTETWRQMQRRFESACSNANGTIQNGECMIKICYRATVPPGAGEGGPIQNCKPMRIGTNVMCSYTTFGFSEGDMEFKAKATAEQEAAKIAATMTLITGGIEAGMNVVTMIKTSAELKNASKGEGDIIYFFSNKGISEGKTCLTKTYDKEIVKNGCEGYDNDEPDNDEGGKFCSKKTSSYNTYEKICKGETTTGALGGGDSNDDMPSCNDTTYSESEEFDTASPYQNGKSCWVFIKNSSELAKTNKANELVRKFGAMNNPEVEEARERVNMMNAIGAQTTAGMYAQGLGSTFSSSGGSEDCATARSIYATNNTLLNEVNTYNSQNPSEKLNPGTCKQTGTKVGNGFEYTCLTQATTANACKFEKNRYVKINTDAGTYASTYSYKYICTGDCNDCTVQNTPIDHMKYNSLSAANKKCYEVQGTATAGGATNIMNMSYDIKQMNNEIKTLTKEDRKTIWEAERAEAQYNENQKKIKEKNEEIASLKAQKEASMSAAIQGGMNTVLNGGLALSTANKAIEANRGLRTGMCWVGEPSKGLQFATEGQAKAVGWR